ncbi:MAG: hypothetical protein M8467_04700 [Anaerolineae bacterium]|nr:hypothetical protein [Anaerolineae bacterium]
MVLLWPAQAGVAGCQPSSSRDREALALPRELVDLNGGEWRLGRAPDGSLPHRPAWSELSLVDQWLPAMVPGNVRADLVRAGRLPELTFGTQFKDSRWVDDHCWWFVRDWSLDLEPGQRVHLVLRGIDYISDLFVNGHPLGRHEGMFSPQVHPVTHLLQRDNVLAIRILGSSFLPNGRSSLWEKLLNRFEAHLGGLPGHFPDRRDTLKCQMSYGWDFAPPLRTMGIWDDVYAIISGGAWIRQLATRTEFGANQASLLAEIEIEVDGLAAWPCQIRGILQPETFAGQTLSIEQQIQVQAGTARAVLRWEVPEPRLWWPWDQGRPDLYRLVIQLADGAGRVLDTESRLVGLRRVELDGWTLRVNDRPVYARGGNWVPAHILPGLVTQADYEALLSLAQGANMNLLRVWGGGLREKRAFYELCDRLGMLVWQEFPFACAFVTRFPRSPDYLALVERESRAIVRDLRHHACLALWCGGNEFSPDRNRPLLATLRQVLDEEDPSRPFLPASPTGGDSHYWRVWHNYQPPAAYLADDASFASEFGLQAASNVQALRRFLPEEDLWPPGPSWLAHGADLRKLRRYARPFLARETPAEGVASTFPGRTPGEADLPGLEAFVQASQRAQANGLQIAIEHYRRLKARGNGGALVWQLNEPWPAISWALVDYWRQPKPAYRAVQRAFQPLLISLAYPLRRYRAGDELPAWIWLIQDRDQAWPGCELEITLWDQEDRATQALRQEVDVPACTAQPIGQFSWILPAGEDWRLTCQLWRQAEVLSSNVYHLGVYDGLQPTLRQRLWAWMTNLVVPG